MKINLLECSVYFDNKPHTCDCKNMKRMIMVAHYELGNIWVCNKCNGYKPVNLDEKD